MRRPFGRTMTARNYSTIKGRRRLEIVGFLASAWLIVGSTVYYVISTQAQSHVTSITCQQDSDTYKVNLSYSSLVNGSVLGEDGLTYPPGTYWTVDNDTIWGCPCLIKPCIHKCCPDGVGLMNEEVEYDGAIYTHPVCGRKNSYFDQTKSKVFSLDNTSSLVKKEIGSDYFYVIIGDPVFKKREKHPLDQDEKDDYLLMDDGRVLNNRSSWEWLNYSEFCVESSPDPSTNEIFVCFQNDDGISITPEWKYQMRGIGMLISVPCLLMTIITYRLLPQLFNLHGKALICHLISLLVAYSYISFILLTSIQLQSYSLVCHITAFSTQFFVLASFFWLNVLCFDIWWVFSGLMPLRGSQKSAEHYKFLLYSLYAWGCPLAIVLLTALIQYLPGLPDFILKPDVGVTACYFVNREATLLYLYLPLGVLVYLNTVMFIITALRFKIHSRSVRHLQRGDSRRHIGVKKSTGDEKRFNLYLKLSIMMGLNWALEIVDFLIDSESWIWIIPELFNVLQGLLYLQQFVLQRRILYLLNMKLCPGHVLVAPEDSVRSISSTRNGSSSRRPTLTESTAVVSCEPEPCKTECSPL